MRQDKYHKWSVQGGAKNVLNAVAPALIAEVLARFGRGWLRVNGVSMLPAIRPRDMILVHSCSIEELEPADVVLFTTGGRLFAHRVVRLVSSTSGLRTVVTKGDTHHHEDLPITADQLLGRVLSVSRNGRLQAAPFPYSCVASMIWMTASRCIQLMPRFASLTRFQSPARRDDSTSRYRAQAATPISQRVV